MNTRKMHNLTILIVISVITTLQASKINQHRSGVTSRKAILSLVDVKDKEVKQALENSCYLRSNGRGVGVVPTNCPPNTEKNVELCYPQCRDGFYGAGPVCWQRCPDGYRDNGAFCAKPKSYGRGVGKISQKLCGGNQCEKCLGLWYKRCQNGFSPAGCNICSPGCPNGLKNMGVSCTKQSYGRTAGTSLDCQAGKQKDAGLCYKPCRPDQKGIGPVCWNTCPPGSQKCAAFCLVNQSCGPKIVKILGEVAKLILSVAGQSGKDASEAALKIGKELVIPYCKQA